MCRLFGMTGGEHPVQATFWLLDAPDSLELQSERNPDGTGIGYFDPEGRPHVDKQPIAAFADRRFATEAKEIRSRTFVSHVRHATNGELKRVNTHPFELDGRIFAHNGVIDDVDALEAHLGDDLSRVRGDTDSERYFALVTREIERCGGDVTAGLRTAAGWIAEHLSVLAINCVLITDDGLWALRYPAEPQHTLFLLERAAGGSGAHATETLDGRSHEGTRVHSAHGQDHPLVLVASERLDEDPGWQELGSGELIHVDPALHVHRTQITG